MRSIDSVNIPNFVNQIQFIELPEFSEILNISINTGNSLDILYQYYFEFLKKDR